MRLILAAILALAGCSPAPPNASAINSPEAFAERASVEFPFDNRITIAVHGHSVPAGYTTTPDIDTMGAYPQLLLADLSAAWRPVLSGLDQKFANSAVGTMRLGPE